jgi:hypothetical protein
VRFVDDIFGTHTTAHRKEEANVTTTSAASSSVAPRVPAVELRPELRLKLAGERSGLHLAHRVLKPADELRLGNSNLGFGGAGSMKGSRTSRSSSETRSGLSVDVNSRIESSWMS